MFGKNNPNFGKKVSNDIKTKIREAVSGDKNARGFLNKTHTEKTKTVISKKLTDINRQRLSTQTHNFLQKVTCPHCNKTGQKNNMYRYHFDKCKNSLA